ncbi:MAG: hypothetical protein PHU21_06325 [Elusimicrobia bacterium]|nr:hypothetical protein [Elusimicrobiota bacterium]
MRTQRAEELRKEWGDKPCSHPHLEKEYFQGMPTGAFVCTKCGAVRAGVTERELLAVG